MWPIKQVPYSCISIWEALPDQARFSLKLSCMQQQWRNEGGTIPRAPNHCGVAEKPQQCHKYFLQYSTFVSERSQVRIWGRQTCFLSRAPFNLVTPLCHRYGFCYKLLLTNRWPQAVVETGYKSLFVFFTFVSRPIPWPSKSSEVLNICRRWSNPQEVFKVCFLRFGNWQKCWQGYGRMKNITPATAASTNCRLITNSHFRKNKDFTYTNETFIYAKLKFVSAEKCSRPLNSEFICWSAHKYRSQSLDKLKTSCVKLHMDLKIFVSK